MIKKKLLNRAKKILNANWRGGYTVPSSYLYPHQWSWDSAFISMGYLHYHPKRAQQELLSLFEGQWGNGMLPHIVYRSKGSYFPTPEYWETDLSPYAPSLSTSGITQPPVHAVAVLNLYEHARDKEGLMGFLSDMFPRLCAFHRFLLTQRDPEKTGLVTIFHPWESGLDNSVRWDEALSRIQVQDIPVYNRVDINAVNPSMRPSDEAYDRYVFLVEQMKKHGYVDEEIYGAIDFKIKDVVFSSILYMANRALLSLADILGEDTGEIRSWLVRTQKNYRDYFCSKGESYRLVYDFDLVAKKRIEKRTDASLIGLYTDILSKEEVEGLIAWIKHSHVCRESCVHHHPAVTSLSVDEVAFNPLNYWRGPIWVNMNWLLYRGLLNSGFIDEAFSLRDAVIDLIDEHGFYEYYNPLTGDGLGSDNFSWTAALLIDFLHDSGGNIHKD